MKIEITNELSEKQLKDVHTLLEACWKFDGTKKEPFLSNRLNFDLDMPAFFLAYEKELVGFISVYVDEKDPEISLFVKPEYRKKEISKKLINEYRNSTKEYSLGTEYFVTERVFLDKNLIFLSKTNMEISDTIELLLERKSTIYEFESMEDIVFQLLSKELIEEVASLQTASFGGSLEVSSNYVNEAFEDDNTSLYVLIKEGDVIASCTINHSNPLEDYFYGLSVDKKYRRMGLASYLIKNIVNNRHNSATSKRLRLAVDKENSAARKLYESLGFEVITDVAYLKKI